MIWSNSDWKLFKSGEVNEHPDSRSQHTSIMKKPKTRNTLKSNYQNLKFKDEDRILRAAIEKWFTTYKW